MCEPSFGIIAALQKGEEETNVNREFEEKAEQTMQEEVTLDNLQLSRSKRFPGQNISVFDWTQNHSQEEAGMFPIDVCLQKQTAKEVDDISKSEHYMQSSDLLFKPLSDLSGIVEIV